MSETGSTKVGTSSLILFGESKNVKFLIWWLTKLDQDLLSM